MAHQHVQLNNNNNIIINQHEFLPLCDVLFNIISLASYFCDVVFDLAMGYALANHPTAPAVLFPISIILIVTSLIISQLVSIRWYLWGARGKLNPSTDTPSKNYLRNWTLWCVVLLHTSQVGVLWRYFKLFIPVDLTYVKHEVRELCVLRLIHAFCEAAPMLLLQLYLLSTGLTSKDLPRDRVDSKLSELTAVSAGLSLWSVCWAVASFSKGAARLRNLERLVLTWLGVLAQLAWRLGTVSARVGALVAYASLYGGSWLLVVLALHWLSMLTWLLLTPDGLFHGGERLTLTRKTFLASLLAFVYVFAYVNLHETNHRQKMIIFYTVMFLENCLLISVWAIGASSSGHEHNPGPGSGPGSGTEPGPGPGQLDQLRPITLVLILMALFFGGLFFMGLYYRFFHVRRLGYEAGGRMNTSNSFNMDGNADKQFQYNYNNNSNNSNNNNNNNYDNKVVNDVQVVRKVKLSNSGIPGVFNCRFTNPTVVALNRKKKKPTSFVPPPHTTAGLGFCDKNYNTRQLIPFWKRPLNEDEEDWNAKECQNAKEQSVQLGTLNVHLIREKLREKKQQQLRELRAIQEEIKEGKLVPPGGTSSDASITGNPPPQKKLQPNNTLGFANGLGSTIALSPTVSASNGNVNGLENVPTQWPPIKMHCLVPPAPPNYHVMGNGWKRERPETPEILLAPRCLPHHYPHWTSNQRLRGQNNDEDSTKEPNDDELSDLEGSQVSLPRSYTLPREFKYNNSTNNPTRERRINISKVQSSRFYLPSTNSSDGDVDSADNEDETDTELHHQQHHHQRDHNNKHTNIDNNTKQYIFTDNRQLSPQTTAIDNSCLNTTDNLNNSTTSTAVNSSIDNDNLDCYLNNSYGSRVNQLLKAKVKHETKL
ncbi:uncharacterized protein LOC130673481 [Microplitis mediator]|uniref:uncharacterized protein LOC130673481 n=1 Tax=Microplitis mediator TaxID=375433 RepID=UPI0025579BEB|nr:uncharacterized protein LOC130673481 [Microplitis mediator]